MRADASGRRARRAPCAGRRSRRRPRRRRGRRLADLVGGEELIRGGVAQRVEEPAAAVRVSPALGMYPAGVVAQVKIMRPLLGADLRRDTRTGNVRLPAVDELSLWALAAVGAVDEQHASLSARPPPRPPRR